VQRKIYILRNLSTNQPGGVELEYNELSIFLAKNGLMSEYSTKDEVHKLVSPGDLVYIQEEGRLSLDYLHFAKRLLSRGVIIYEKNVFALPSKFRPVDPNYRMILMSLDGIYRYALRGSLKTNQQKNIYLVPNLPLSKLGDKQERIAKRSFNESYTLRIMRAGRSDSTKWSNVEVQFCENLCNINPDRNLELNLIGCPREYRQESKTPNFVINQFDYSKSLDDFYITNDCYLLYSKIGETFGNTLFEAAEYKLRVVFVFDISWDCGPIEYLNSYYPNSKCVEISNLESMDLSLFSEENQKVSSDMAEIFLEINRKLFMHELDEIAYPRPSIISSIQYLVSLGRTYNVTLFRISVAIVKEIIRERTIIKYLVRK